MGFGRWLGAVGASSGAGKAGNPVMATMGAGVKEGRPSPESRSDVFQDPANWRGGVVPEMFRPGGDPTIGGMASAGLSASDTAGWTKRAREGGMERWSGVDFSGWGKKSRNRLLMQGGRPGMGGHFAPALVTAAQRIQAMQTGQPTQAPPPAGQVINRTKPLQPRPGTAAGVPQRQGMAHNTAWGQPAMNIGEMAGAETDPYVNTGRASAYNI